VNSLESVTQLNDEGRFSDALRALNDVAIQSAVHNEREVLRAELLERVGRFGSARGVLQTLMRANRLSASDRSSCEFVLGKIEWEEGLTESAIGHLQRSVQLATESRDLRRRCLPNMLLLVTLCDRSGPDAVAPILSELRNDATRLGEPRILAALHSFIGQMDAKRGLLTSSLWHVQRSQRILASAPNIWIEAQIEFTRTNIAVLVSDYRSALDYGRRAVQLAEESGGAACQRTCLGNLGFVYYSLGQFDEAVNCLERAIGVLPSAGESRTAMIDTMARIRLAQGRLDDCRTLLDGIESGIRIPGDRLLYPHRHAALTRANLLAREGRIEEALEQTECTLLLADEAKDQFLWQRALLSKALFLQQVGRETESLALVESSLSVTAQFPDLQAQYETMLACALVSAGRHGVAHVHRERAERIYASLHYAPGLLELSRSWEVATQGVLPTIATSEELAPRTAISASADPSAGGGLLQSVAALMAQTGRPEFMAHELVGLIRQAGCVHRGAVVLIGGRLPEVLATTGCSADAPETVASDAWPRRLVMGPVRDRSAELWLEPKSDIESIATVNAIASLLSIVHEIERGRAEHEQRLTLWPIEDASLEGEQAVVNGQMRELMIFAKRIATTNVSVLLTGESGTGKEILARAIHNYSYHSDKPFVPFNCAAIPRDMLESQLFGHRRGAFTGAERDHMGVIRAARGGTLFLDEIGELSLDLQPKLLRFLESGEICPLGESMPFTVNLRVIAATNANLESIVKNGLFREDLFYRLNVVRLQVPPLRERRDEIPALVHHLLGRAATEYRKGNIRIDEDTMERLVLFPWPGNIRQLHNEVRRMVALADPGALLTPQVLSVEIADMRPPSVSPTRDKVALRGESLRAVLDRVECDMIKAALRDHRGKTDAAAKALGISRKGLYLKRQRLGV
jgi:DNA-binding NtrC family response regulator/tetratricopeptide (TPR) repeat protein